jgi:hypothetical protein
MNRFETVLRRIDPIVPELLIGPPIPPRSRATEIR